MYEHISLEIIDRTWHLQARNSTRRILPEYVKQKSNHWVDAICSLSEFLASVLRVYIPEMAVRAWEREMGEGTNLRAPRQAFPRKRAPDSPHAYEAPAERAAAACSYQNRDNEIRHTNFCERFSEYVRHKFCILQQWVSDILETQLSLHQIKCFDIDFVTLRLIFGCFCLACVRLWVLLYVCV